MFRFISWTAMTACAADANDDTAGDTDADADTDTDTDTDADTDTDPPLEEGRYSPTTNAIEDDTCGGLTEALGIAAAAAEIAWTSDEMFTLDYPCCDVGTVCTIASDDSVTCDGYTQEIPVDGTTTLHVASSTAAFAIVATDAFDQVEALEWTCEGDGCTTFADSVEATLPCAHNVDESFTLAR